MHFIISDKPPSTCKKPHHLKRSPSLGAMPKGVGGQDVKNKAIKN